jgi:XTP/dITP diphosphohydrolase
VCAIACFDGTSLVVARGVNEGTIATTPRGSAGFGWDPIFVPQGADATYAQMAPEEKDRVSHRGRAWRELASQLRKREGSDPAGVRSREVLRNS